MHSSTNLYLQQRESIKDAVYLVIGSQILDHEAEGILDLYKKHSKESSFISILTYIESLYESAQK